LNKKVVAILGLGEHQINGIKTASKLFKIIGFDSNPSAIGKKYVDKFYNFELSQRKKILNICKVKKIIKVISFNSEVTLETVYWLNKKINNEKFPQAKIIQIKSNLRNFLRKNSLAYPRYWVLNNPKQISERYFPCVIKPTIGSGSRGVFFAKNILEFQKLYQDNKNHYNHPAKILVEKYIRGTEYAADGWINNSGEIIIGAISKKKRSKFPNLYDESLIINYKNKKISKILKEYLLNFFNKLNIKFHPFHLEFKIYKEKLFLIDLSLRGAGFTVYSELLSKITNQNTDKILINFFFKKQTLIKKSNNKIFFMKFFYSKNYYKIKKNIYKIKRLKTFKIIKNYKDRSNFRRGHILLESLNIKKLKFDIIRLNSFI
jgi:hypothetical protein